MLRGGVCYLGLGWLEVVCHPLVRPLPDDLMASGEPPHSGVVLEAGAKPGAAPGSGPGRGAAAAAAEGDRKRARAGTDDGGYNSATSATYATANQHNPGGGSENKKRKTSGLGSRGVASLTPEQLEKKRANGELAFAFSAAAFSATFLRSIADHP